MLQASDLRGLCAMVPSFTTPDGGSMDARQTIDVDLLRTGVERMIADGVDVLATTGTFGEVYNLLWEEFQVLTKAAVEVVAKRVPLFIGCTSPNPREVLDKMRFVREAGADGVLVGMPYYIPGTPDNAVQFYTDIAERFPELAIMIYHNPTYHHITLPVPAVAKMAARPNIVAMKDSHRDPGPFLKLMELTNRRVAVFVYQGQLYPYQQLGAAGCWSIGAWMGPAPLFALRDACAAGDWAQAEKIALDLSSDTPLSDLRWRENSLKISINEAGYCQVGPLRPPFTNVPDDVVEAAKARGRRWREMAERYQAARTGVAARA